MDNHRHVTTLIPCAGNGERFNIAGHGAAHYPPAGGGSRAKHLIPVEWAGQTRPMVGHVLRALPDVGRVVLGVRPELVAETMCLPASVVPVMHSSGQADTLLQMIEWVAADSDDGPCLVVNCDAIIRRPCVEHLLWAVTRAPEYCMACCVQRTENLGFSFVDQVPHPARFAEKQRLSSFGMSGAWAFRSMAELRDAIRAAMAAGDEHRGEIYLSHALNHLPGPNLAWQVDPATDVVDWNTPEALAASGAKLMVSA